MCQPAGISGRGRAELARVFATGRRFIEPADVAIALDVDAETAAQKLARWAADGWVRRVRRGLYIGVPVHATDPSVWAEDALLVASAVWSPCYFTGWTAANHWSLTEQVFRTTVLKTTKVRVRRATARLLDRDYLLTHVSDDALTWGMKGEWHDETNFLFADPHSRCHRRSRRPEARRWDPACRRDCGRLPRGQRSRDADRLRRPTGEPRSVQTARVHR